MKLAKWNTTIFLSYSYLLRYYYSPNPYAGRLYWENYLALDQLEGCNIPTDNMNGHHLPDTTGRLEGENGETV